jgi:hypothetical protein
MDWKLYIGRRAKGEVVGYAGMWVEGEVVMVEGEVVGLGAKKCCLWCSAVSCELIAEGPPVVKDIPVGALVEVWDISENVHMGVFASIQPGSYPYLMKDGGMWENARMVDRGRVEEFLRILDEYEHE